MPNGESGKAPCPAECDDFAPGQLAGPGDVVDPGDAPACDVLEGADDVVFLDELHEGIEPGDRRAKGRERFVLIGVRMSVPSTLANRRRLTTVEGLSSAKFLTRSSTSMRDRSTLEPAPFGTGGLL